MSAPADRFNETAAGYLVTMAPSLRPIAAEVVRRAGLRAGERVLDLGTGPGTAPAMAQGGGRSVTGVDAAGGMLEIAREAVPSATFLEMDFTRMDLADGSFDAVLAVHALLFADDPVAALAEWRRVTAQGGRLSLSVPGPDRLTPPTLYADVYRRFRVEPRVGYPSADTLASWAGAAGWDVGDVAADPTTEIVLPDEPSYRLWRSIGGRRQRADERSEEEEAALTDAMLAATPRDAGGRFHIPFGTVYLTARNAPS